MLSIFKFCASSNSLFFLRAANRPFAASHSRSTKPPRWRAKAALRQDKQRTYIILNCNFLCLSCPSATFVLQHGGFVPREWLAAKGLLAQTTFFKMYCYLPVIRLVNFWHFKRNKLLVMQKLFSNLKETNCKTVYENHSWVLHGRECPNSRLEFQKSTKIIPNCQIYN